MAEVLLDSAMLMDHIRGYEPARQYLNRFEAGEVAGALIAATALSRDLLRATRNLQHCTPIEG